MGKTFTRENDAADDEDDSDASVPALAIGVLAALTKAQVSPEDRAAAA